MPDRTRETIDIRQTVCGLMPELLDHLERLKNTDVREVAFLVRPGVRDEIVSALGTGGRWDLTFETAIGHDVLVCTRRPEADKPTLNLLDY